MTDLTPLKPYDAIYRTSKGEITKDADKGSFIGTVTKFEDGWATVSTKYGQMATSCEQVKVKIATQKKYVNVFEHRR